MKIIIENSYLRSFRFNTEGEYNLFFSNQEVPVRLVLPEHGGSFSYCYVAYHSLIPGKLFDIGFDSDVSKVELSFLFWGENDLFVLDNGNEIFLINSNMTVVASYPITTPLIGFYVTSKKSLLILHEAEMKLVSERGDILQYEQFDLLEDYIIMDSCLLLDSSGLTKVIEL